MQILLVHDVRAEHLGGYRALALAATLHVATACVCHKWVAVNGWTSYTQLRPLLRAVAN